MLARNVQRAQWWRARKVLGRYSENGHSVDRVISYFPGPVMKKRKRFENKRSEKLIDRPVQTTKPNCTGARCSATYARRTTRMYGQIRNFAKRVQSNGLYATVAIATNRPGCFSKGKVLSKKQKNRSPEWFVALLKWRVRKLREFSSSIFVFFENNLCRCSGLARDLC